MRLSPQEIDKLILHQAGALAQKRLARGVRLNYPEAVALIATQLLELVRDGRTVVELMDLGRRVLARRHVLPGVPEMVAEVQVEGTFPDGSKLVTVHHPIALDDTSLDLAFYGSFLPQPSALLLHEPPSEVEPGAYEIVPGFIELNAERRTRSFDVVNTGDRPVQVGSHYHFVETNRALVFDRASSIGMRLDIPAGTAVRFEPGERKTVTLVDIAGRRVVRGGNAIVDGPANARSVIEERLRSLGFGEEQER